MAFVSPDGTATPVTSGSARPILTTICTVLGALELLAGGLGAIIALRDYRYGIGTALAVVLVSVVGALVIFGLGQAVDFLARTAAAAERTAQATERMARQ